MTTFISPPCVCVCVWALRLSVCVAAQLPSSLLPVRSACHISFNFPITATPAAQSSQVCVWQEAVVTRCRQYYDVQYDEVEEMLHGEKVVMHSWWNNQTPVKNNIVLERDSDMKHHTSVIKTHMELLIIQKCRGMHVQTCQHSGFLSRSFTIFNLLSLAVRVIGHFLALINAISASQLRGGLQILTENLPFFPHILMSPDMHVGQAILLPISAECRFSSTDPTEKHDQVLSTIMTSSRTLCPAVHTAETALTRKKNMTGRLSKWIQTT